MPSHRFTTLPPVVQPTHEEITRYGRGNSWAVWHVTLRGPHVLLSCVVAELTKERAIIRAVHFGHQLNLPITVVADGVWHYDSWVTEVGFPKEVV